MIATLLTQEAIDLVWKEQEHQYRKWGLLVRPNGTGRPADKGKADIARQLCDKYSEAGTLTWRDIMREEVLEAFAESDKDKLKKELVQVASVAVSWIESLIREGA